MSDSFDYQDLAYRKNQARFRSDAKEGLFPLYGSNEGFLPRAMTESEYQRLLYVFLLGDEVYTKGLAKEYGIDPLQDDIQISVRGKLMAYDVTVAPDCCIDPPPGDPPPAGGISSGGFDPPIKPPITGTIDVRPPGYPPNDGYVTDPRYASGNGSDPFSGHVDMLCADNKVLSLHGTNHTGNFFDYGAPFNPANFGFGLLPVNDLLIDYIPIKDTIDAKIAANGHLPHGAVVKTVYFEHNGSWLDSGHAGFFSSAVSGVESGIFNFRATRPHLQLVSGQNKSLVELRPTELIKMLDVTVGGTWSDNIRFGLETTAAIDEQGKYTQTNYNTINEVFFYCRMPPTTPNIFFSNTDSPFFEMCITGLDYTIQTTKFSGHFNLGSIVTVENPHVAGQMNWVSDVPDGSITGIASRIPSEFWTGTEIAAGQGKCLLLDPDNTDGRGGTPQAVEMYVMDGYTPNVEKAYTNAHVHARMLGGAGTVTLNIHRSAGGPGDSFYSTMPDVGYWTGTPGVSGGTGAFYDMDFDISSMNLQIGDPLFTVSFTGHTYIFEYAIVLS